MTVTTGGVSTEMPKRVDASEAVASSLPAAAAMANASEALLAWAVKKSSTEPAATEIGPEG